MRLPEPSAWQFFAALAALLLAYLIAVGSGMDVDVEHDGDHRAVTLVAAALVLGGGILLWLSLRRPPADRRA